MKLSIILFLFFTPIICFSQASDHTAIQLGSSVPVVQHLNFMQVLVGLDGKPMYSSEDKTAVILTLGDVSLVGLETLLQDDAHMTGTDKFKLDELARKIYHNKDAVLSVEEIALLKDRIGKVYGPLVVGAAWRLLDSSLSK